MRNKKAYIISVILVAVYLFAIAVTCNFCGAPVSIGETVETEDTLSEEGKEFQETELEETTGETVAVTEEEVDEQITELPKEKLTADQKRVISLFGHPDQFTIVFDEGNDNNRIDIWIYSDINALFMFENGAYSDSDYYFPKESRQSGYELLPQDFTYGMAPFEVKMLVGQKGDKSIEEITGLNVLTFGRGDIICIFNPENKLISASKQNKLSDNI